MTTVADRLAALACELAGRIRDEDPAEVHAELANMNHAQLVSLASVMAALIPDDRPLSELLAWIDQPPSVHRGADEKGCKTCDTPIRVRDVYCDPCRAEARRETMRYGARKARRTEQPMRVAS